MTEQAATDRLREEIRTAIRASGVKQIWIAEQLGVSQKHLSQMLTGRVGLPLDWAQRIAALCGHTATITVQPAADAELRAQLAAVIKALGAAETELAALRAVARGYCPACGRGDAAPTVEDWEQQKQRASQLEIANRALNTAAVEALERAERTEAAGGPRPRPRRVGPQRLVRPQPPQDPRHSRPARAGRSDPSDRSGRRPGEVHSLPQGRPMRPALQLLPLRRTSPPF